MKRGGVACWLVWLCSLAVGFVALGLVAVMPSARLLCQSPKKQRLFEALGLRMREPRSFA